MVAGLWLSGCVAGAGCGTLAPATRAQPPSLTRDLERESLERAVKWRNPHERVVMALATDYLAGNHSRAGYAYFDARAKESPDRTLFLALSGLFQARLAPEVPLLRRVAW